MANDLTDNPWVLDTAGVTVLWQPKVFVDHIEFSDYAVDTDTATVKDRNGRVIVSFNGAVDLQPIRTGKVGIISGLALATLSAGKIRVFIK